MEAVYISALAAKKMRGMTLHKVRSSMFTAGVTQHGGPFLSIAKRTREDFEAGFAERTDALVKKLDKVFADTQHDVNQVCSTKEDGSPEAKKMREELLSMLPEARERLNNDILRRLDECKKPRSDEI